MIMCTASIAKCFSVKPFLPLYLIVGDFMFLVDDEEKNNNTVQVAITTVIELSSS
jgi:hypothetical protein